MLFARVLSHALAPAVTLATSVKPSLTNPVALVVALGGIAMALAMVAAAVSFTRLEREAARQERSVFDDERRPAKDPRQRSSQQVGQ